MQKDLLPENSRHERRGKALSSGFRILLPGRILPPFSFAFPRSSGLSALRQQPRQHSQRMIYTRSRLCHSGGQRS